MTQKTQTVYRCPKCGYTLAIVICQTRYSKCCGKNVTDCTLLVPAWKEKPVTIASWGYPTWGVLLWFVPSPGYIVHVLGYRCPKCGAELKPEELKVSVA